ncbi:MAG: SH3 domain-containing protein [Pseudomonadota bacterium]
MAKNILFSTIFFLTLCITPISVVKAEEGVEDKPFKSTPYPVPRFVSLNADEVFVRSGPGKKYPIQWVFQKDRLPVEIILEFEHWRKIRDHEGQTGWVYGPLLSGQRTGLIVSEELSLMRTKPQDGSAPVAQLEPLLLVSIKACELQFCRVEASGTKGWLSKSDIWGVYAEEVF